MKLQLALFVLIGLATVREAVPEACSPSGAVRLVWGAGPWEGNVQICLNGGWGWICQNSFYSNEAKVVCRQLGFNATGSVYRRYAYYGWPDPSLPIWLDQLGCHGTESNIMSCPRPKAIGDASCNHNALAAVLCPNQGSNPNCTEGKLRLLRNQASTPFKSYGRVEICHSNRWGSICDSGWGTPDAKVACGQLGFTASAASSYCCASYGQSYGPVWLSNMGCTSSNNQLSSCTHDNFGTSTCSHSKDAGAGCRGEVTGSCTNGAVKLFRPYGIGPNNDGLALYCNNSRWVGFCDDGWSCHNARLICKKLGFPAALNTRWEGYYGYYKQTDTYRFYCRSTNTDLSQCSYTYRSSCTSLNDQIGVICYKPVISKVCTNGQVRLQNGNTTSEGRVEYCYEGRWNPVCSLTGIAASLICKQLGYNSTLATIIDDQRFNRSDIRSVFSTFSCFSTTPSLAQCNTTMKGSACFTSVSKCTTEVGLRCHNTAFTTCTDGQSRLVNGTLAQEGRVEVCLSGIWGSVCQNGFGQSDAYVICKELGYNGPSPNVYYRSKYGESTGPIVYSNLKCKGWETVLTECTKDTFPSISCSPQNTIGLICKDDCSDGDVRLVGGGFANEGTVEVCMDHMWGLVSDAGWNSSHAKVVCRQLGFTSGLFQPFTGSAFGKPNNRILLKNVKCSGNELKLIDCASNQLGLWGGRKQLATTSVAGVDCIYDEPTDPPCGTKPTYYDHTPGPQCAPINNIVRLTGNSTKSAGRVEYCFNGYWSPLCKMDNKLAEVICRYLGFTHYSYGSIIESGEFGNLMNVSLIDNVTCTGNEDSPFHCTYHMSPSTCTPFCSKNLGIRCFDQGICTNGQVRLMDGIIENEGRVEVCVNGVWGAVCDQGFTKTDANIICKQLGLPDTEPIVLPNSEFGDGTYPIVYSNVTCGGWESSITQCNKVGYESTVCSRKHTAGVLCGYNCNDGDVRLANSLSTSATYEGTVEVCFENLWGLIADTNWSQQDAVVVCRQLGFETTSGTQSVTGSHFGKPNLRLHLSNVACLGTEDSIGQCNYNTYSLSQGKTQLATTDVAGVKCYIPANCVAPPSSGTACSDGSVKLVGGSNSNEGILEYCYKGNWSPFCYLGPNEATVACRQLGHTSYDMTAVFTDGRFGSLAGVSLFQNVSCAVNLAATQLGDCLIADSCQSTCNNVVGLRCYDAANCQEGQVRLVNGTSTEGRLEVCYKGVWGSVCGVGFDVTDAFVACKELGLGMSEPTVYTNSHYGDGDGAIVYYNTSCRGYESSIVGCSKQMYGTFTCSRNNVAGVACQEGCNNGAVRLISGSSSSEGTVEVCYYNTWGLVTDGGWSDTEAQVVCRQLNLQGGSARTGSPYGRPNAPVLISNTQCTGSESSISSCQYTHLSEDQSSGLSGANVAGVKCSSATIPPSTASHHLSSSGIGLTVLSLLLTLFIAISVGLVAFMIYKWKKGPKRYSPIVTLNNDPQDASNPTATANMWPNGEKDEDEEDDEMLQLMNE